MTDFGRFMKDINTNMQQMVQMMNQMQGLYKSFSQLSPSWKEMYTSFQAQEQQQEVDQVNQPRSAGRRNATHKGTIPNRRSRSK